MPSIESVAAGGALEAATGPVVLDAAARGERIRQARPAARRLADAGVSVVALGWVDNTGHHPGQDHPAGAAGARGRLGRRDVAGVRRVPGQRRHHHEPDIGGPGGDLRLVPDPDRITALAGQPGWAWAPVDRFTQEGRVYAACQRSFARRMTDRALEQGLELRMSFEVEWALGTEQDGQFRPACSGPAYGMTRVIELSDYGREVVGGAGAPGGHRRAVPPRVRRRASSRSRSARPIRSPRPTTACWSGRRSAPCRRGGTCRCRSPPRSSPGRSATAGTFTSASWRDGQNLLAGGPGRLRPDHRRRGVRRRHPGRAARADRGSARRAWPATCAWCPRTGPGCSSAGAGRTGRPRCAWSPAQPGSGTSGPTSRSSASTWRPTRTWWPAR